MAKTKLKGLEEYDRKMERVMIDEALWGKKKKKNGDETW